jgi:aspartate carbamoyltransferase catalytic subunit
LKHLLYLKDLNQETINQILDTAENFLDHDNQPFGSENILEDQTLANLFFEPSTRTRNTFEIASKKLGADVINIDEEHSARTKGESLIDTIKTLEAMGISYFVIRNKQKGIFNKIINSIEKGTHLISAGESHISHPTQGLLDLVTIKRNKKNFTNIKVAILGDISHSRVTRSLYEGLKIMNTGKIILISPIEYRPDMLIFKSAAYTDDINRGLKNADVVVTLRVQKERMKDKTQFLDTNEYYNNYGLTTDRLQLCKKDVIVMHPGPMNRGVEIENEVADGANSVIREQVTNGIATRMAILSIIEKSAG